MVVMRWTIDYIAKNPFPDSTPLTNSLLILALSLLVLEFVIFVLFELVERVINKLLKVDYRESLLAYCILVANYSFKGEADRAGKQVNGFIMSLLGIKRTVGREYTKEINHLANGRKQLRRMLKFSGEKNPELLLNFGCSIYWDCHPMAFLYLKQIIHNAEEYGKLEGWLKSIDNLEKLERNYCTHWHCYYNICGIMDYISLISLEKCRFSQGTLKSMISL